MKRIFFILAIACSTIVNAHETALDKNIQYTLKAHFEELKI